MGERRVLYRVLVEKPEGKRQLGKPRQRWENNFKMNLQEVGCWLWTKSRWFRFLNNFLWYIFKSSYVYITTGFFVPKSLTISHIL
jgi:hypothetical protein